MRFYRHPLLLPITSLFLTAPLWALDLTERGGAEALLLKGDDLHTHLKNTSLDPTTDEGVISAGKIAIRYNFTFAERTIIHTLPFSLRPFERLRFTLNLPSVSKSELNPAGTEVASRGLGDISLAFRYSVGNPHKISAISQLWVKFPTGSTREFNVNIPVGSGSYDFLIAQGIGKRFPKSKLELMATVGYRVNTTFATRVNHIILKSEAGNSFHYWLTSELGISRKISATLKAGGAWLQEGWQEAFGVRTNNNSQLFTFDIAPGIRYKPGGGFASLFLDVALPAASTFDPEVSNPRGRDFIVNFGGEISF